MQESANNGGAQLLINDIGDRLVASFLGRLKPENQEAVLTMLADENGQQMYRLFAEHCEGTFLGLARLEGISPELLQHSRVQMMTLRSFLLALSNHGALAARQEHPIQMRSGEDPETDDVE